MFYLFNILTIFTTIVFLPSPAFARCAVCYTNGLSGASIAVIIIILSAFFLFFANKFVQNILDKYKF
jgi:hypothetical protein